MRLMVMKQHEKLLTTVDAVLLLYFGEYEKFFEENYVSCVDATFYYVRECFLVKCILSEII